MLRLIPAPDTESTPEADPPRYRAAYERLESRILAVPLRDCKSIRIDIRDVVQRALAAAARVAIHRSDAERLPFFDVSCFDDLEACALALGHAHTCYLAATADVDTVPSRVTEVRKLRRQLRTQVKLLIGEGLIPPGALKRLTGTRAFDDAASALALVQVLHNHWDDVQGRTMMDAAELAEAEKLAGSLVEALAHRESLPKREREARRVREQAFTLLVATYGQVRRAILFLREATGDADQIAPPLYAGRYRHRSGRKARSKQQSQSVEGTSP